MGRRLGYEADLIALDSWLQRPERLHITEPIWCGTGEVAVIFSVTTKTVTRWCESGIIAGACRIGGPRARWAIPVSWVYAMLAKAEEVRPV